MLSAWLDAPAYQELLTHRRERRAFARPSVGVQEGLFEWTRLGRVLAPPHEPDVLVTRDGALREAAAPRSLAEVDALLAAGSGLVVRRAERHDEALAQLAGAVQRALAGQVHIQLFVTPEKTRGFSWHYDQEDVLILQTVGAKTYFLRENTVVARPAVDVDFARYRDERSPLQACTLHAGDLLYLPTGTWHMGRAESTAFSVSLGITPER